MHNKMSFIAYSLMIVAYVLFIYDKKGFSVTMIIFAVIVIGVNYWSKKHKPEQSGDSQPKQSGNIQSVGDGVKGNNVSLTDIVQEATTDGSSDITQSVGNGAEANGDIAFKNIEQNIDRVNTEEGKG
ncbi:MAG: hypothetical protein HQL61_00790 [Magnetococcales bacterium]|uniref:Uncharacterized protein n=1 Tax=Candidatus Magnetobacterium casense TaxID=1455061 RepID=A0ABS6RW45_9BACT|nr:hypothetical protein [Candidatus Magnetobacterium casensis]MBF0606071.1 hypothetical protein [Nitrospirota bacterium]MBV6340811.1 hypothetical protein [Candidatus Magnetobacterium casensis]